MLVDVAQYDLAVFDRLDRHLVELCERRAVTRVYSFAANLDLAGRADEIGLAVLVERIGGGFAGLQSRARGPRLRANRKGIVAFEAGCERDKLAGAITLRERTGAPLRLPSGSICARAWCLFARPDGVRSINPTANVIYPLPQADYPLEATS